MSRLLAALAPSLVVPTLLFAGEPTLRGVNIHGLQIGATTTLVIDGDSLGTEPKLVLPFAVKQELLRGSNDKRATIAVSLDEKVVPGFYNMWLVTPGGCSLPLVMAVDRLPQKVVSAAPETPTVALHGAVSSGGVSEIKFNGKAGETLMVEVEAHRLGSKIRPIVHLASPKHAEIAWSWASPLLAGDARLEARLPEAGVYTIAIHDVEYAGGSPSFFRVKLGQWSAVDRVFPPVVPLGKDLSVELLGPGVDRSIKIPQHNTTTLVPLAWPADGTWSGPRPFVEYSARTELIEEKSKTAEQDLPAGPVAVSGRLLVPGEEDRYRLPVAPGSKIKLEVFAERYGSPLDASIVIRDAKGAVVAQADDSPGTIDPMLEYTVPAKVDTLVVGIVDAQLRAGSQSIYRLTVDPLGAEAPRDFALSTTAQRLSLDVGGRSVVPVLVQRRGYQGPIALAADGLPAGVRLEGTTIAAGAEGALVTVVRGKPAADKTKPLEPMTLTWHGKATEAPATAGLVRPVMLKGHPLERVQPWLASEMELAPSAGKAEDFDVEWGALPSDARLVLGEKLPLPVKLKRADEKALVRLTLLVSQITPMLNNRPDPNKTLRVERDVQLGAKQNAGELVLQVPVELSAPLYDLTVQAELLAADKQTVLATAFAPVKRLEVLNPVRIELAGPSPVPVSLTKTGATVKVAGKIERRWVKTGDITVTLAGLPPGARAANAIIKAGKEDFETNLVLAANTPTGELRGITLSATAVPDPKQPNIRIRSADTELVLVVQGADKAAGKAAK